jgi:hypothetical protein
MRKLDAFPASHESGVHGLILLFEENSWNITIFCYLSMQKHLQSQVESFGVTSMDPDGSLPLQDGRDVRGPSLQGVWSNGGEFEFYSKSNGKLLEVSSETGHDLIFIFKGYLLPTQLTGCRD